MDFAYNVLADVQHAYSRAYHLTRRMR